MNAREFFFMSIVLWFYLIVFDNFVHSELVETYRLPNSSEPIKYDLQIVTKIHEEDFSFIGTVKILVKIREATKTITLHARNLNIESVNILETDTSLQLANVTFLTETKKSFLKILSEYQLKENSHYIIYIEYNGEIGKSTFGIYRSPYVDSEGKIIYVAATQFEATSARLAFPCFDEPAFKAEFILTLIHGNNYTALSNMPVDGVPIMNSDGMTTTKFIKSPKMSTYLLAFIISNYQYISEYDDEINVIQSSYFSPMANDQGQRALKNSARTLKMLEDYLGIKYPLSKLDHVGLSKTYGSAMENWGLITYKEDNFIKNSVSDITKTLKDIIIQNHELSHQWFGNLVSPKWWTYAWLNEGFATYYSYIATELVYPNWQINEYFINDVADVVYNWPINHAMSFYVETEAQIKSTFDMISYQKAACFIKMFHHAFNKKTFVKGVQKYLNKFSYSVADEFDLYAMIQEAVDEDEFHLFQGNRTVEKVMQTWTHNEGIPVLSIVRDYNKNTITIQQRSTVKKSDELWWIPLNFITASSPDFEDTRAVFIMPPEKTVTINLESLNITLDSNDWLLVNKQQTGMFHVSYDASNWKLVINALEENPKCIHKINRALLFRELVSILEKDKILIEPGLNLLRYLPNEYDLFVWDAAAKFILALRSFLIGNKAIEIFNPTISHLIESSYDRCVRIPNKNMTVNELNARVTIVDLACKVELKKCLEYTNKLAEDYILKNKPINDLQLLDVALCQGLKYVSDEKFDMIISILKNSDPNSKIYDDIIYSLRCVYDPRNLRKLLENLLTNNSTELLMPYTESIDYLRFLVASNYVARPVVLDFLVEKNKTVSEQASTFASVLKGLAGYIVDKGEQKTKFSYLMDVVKMNSTSYLFASNVSKSNVKTINNGVGSKIKDIEVFNERYGEIILTWFETYNKESNGINLGYKHQINSSLISMMINIL